MLVIDPSRDRTAVRAKRLDQDAMRCFRKRSSARSLKSLAGDEGGRNTTAAIEISKRYRLKFGCVFREYDNNTNKYEGIELSGIYVNVTFPTKGEQER